MPENVEIAMLSNVLDSYATDFLCPSKHIDQLNMNKNNFKLSISFGLSFVLAAKTTNMPLAASPFRATTWSVDVDRIAVRGREGDGEGT